ncbi:ATP-binding protein [Pseudoalteromonas sp.]|uniref:hybrid sensor histidine kinase/response regulator n=1 Tax=Pseudoalteromonas sp. TaxID=53249 RepID=UPI003566C703
MKFLPLKDYYRSLVVALAVPLFVAFLLCLHLYNIKVERAIEKRHADFANVAAQVEHTMAGINDLFSTMFTLYHQSNQHQRYSELPTKVNQYDDYYYQYVSALNGEIVGTGEFAQSSPAALRWQKVVTLAPSFNSTLALMQSLSAVAYVDEQGFAYVARRDRSERLLLTDILQGKFKPLFLEGQLTSSPIITVNNKTYFAIGRQQDVNSDDYILLIYDVQAISNWLKKVSPQQGEYIFMNQYHEVIASSQQLLTQAQRLNQYWPALSVHYDNTKVLKNNHFLMQPIANYPIHAAFYESNKQLSMPIIYETIIEFCFLTVFLSIMFGVFFWLSQRIFIKPMTFLMSYLAHNEDSKGGHLSYQVPLNWQPWFLKVKAVFAKNTQLVESLQQLNKQLDAKLQLQSEKLTRSYEAKERHLALLNTVLNSVPDFIYFKNTDGSFLGCNKAFEAFIGKQQADLMGKLSSDVGLDSNNISALEQQVQQTCMPEQQRVDSEGRAYLLTVAPFYNEQQQLLGVMGIGRDITEQQHTLHALRESESKFRSAIEFAANSVLLLSLDHTILQVNKAARKLFAAHQELPGKSLQSLFSKTQWQEIAATLEQLLNNKKRVYHLTLAHAKLAEWLQLSVSLVWHENGEPLYYIVHIQDISALTKAKHDAERATLAKSRFIANLSHEIRTPLNAVFGLLDMLIEQGLTAKQLQQTEQAKHAAHSLLLLLNSMLDFARVESDEAKLTQAPFCLVDLVDICDSLTAPLCESKNIAFIIDIDPLIAPQLIGDSVRLQQVLGNLLTNAVKFTNTGSITLKMELVHSDATQQSICFRVIDTGLGIDKADQQRLFDAFTQGDESSTRTHQGVGLGLAIVKHAVSLLGGEIALNSDKGQGCEFYFNITVQLDTQNRCYLPRNTLALLSAQSSELQQVANTFAELSCVELATALTSADKLKNYDKLIIDVADTAALFNSASCTEALLANATDVIIVGQQPGFSLPASCASLSVQCIKASALAQRLLSLDSAAANFNVISETSKVNPLLPQQHVAGLLVLAIDDNQLNLDVISSVLQQANINVVTVLSAQQGIDLLATLQPDLILMDVQMPHLDGCQATRLIRRQFDTEQLPIFALTAHCEPADIERSLACGMNKHLTKPVVAKELIGAIAELELTKVSFFEYAFALTQFNLDDVLLNTMITKFAHLCSTQIAQIRNNQDVDELIRLAHSIKGVAGNLGFQRLSQCAKQTEKQLRTTNKAVELTMKELIMQLEQVIAFINVSKVGNVQKS